MPQVVKFGVVYSMEVRVLPMLEQQLITNA